MKRTLAMALLGITMTMAVKLTVDQNGNDADTEIDEDTKKEYLKF